MFGNKVKKNRRMNSREFAEELEESKIWGHKPRTYIQDRPFYTDMNIEPLVNFSLNFHF